jgi:hypothetical protein
MKPYHIATDEEKRKWGGAEEYDLLLGPDGFGCFLGEPEDRTWLRDAAPVVAELNRLYRTVVHLLKIQKEEEGNE